MPASASVASRAPALNCGLRREPGKRRTSTSVPAPAPARTSTSSAALLVPWPTVSTRTRAFYPVGRGYRRPMPEIGYALSSEEHPPSDLVRHARLAEEAGFTFALVSDHFHPW